jgi:hypothetical protein
MGAEIVEDHDVARLQRRREELIDIGAIVADATAFSVVYPGRRLNGNRTGVELRETNGSSTLVNPRTRLTPA